MIQEKPAKGEGTRSRSVRWDLPGPGQWGSGLQTTPSELYSEARRWSICTPVSVRPWPPQVKWFLSQGGTTELVPGTSGRGGGAAFVGSGLRAHWLRAQWLREALGPGPRQQLQMFPGEKSHHGRCEERRSTQGPEGD